MKKGPELFQELMTALLETGTLSNAARKCGVSVSSVFSWISASQKGEPGYTVPEFAGEQDVPLFEAVRTARKMFVYEVVDNLELRARQGHWEQTFYKGQPQWVMDETLSSWSDEDLKQLGMDRFKRDPNNALIPVLQHVQPPVQLSLAVAAAHTRAYANRQTIDLNQKITGGVIRHQIQYGAPKPPAPALPVVEMLPPPPAEEIMLSDEPDADDDDLSDLLGEAIIAPESDATPEPAPVPAETPKPHPEPAAPQTTPQTASGLTPLQRDLMARLKAGPGSMRTAPVQPTGSGFNDQPDDVELKPPAGATKVL